MVDAVEASSKGLRARVQGVCAVIFVTVGHQMPFNRMVQAVDQWAASRNRHDVFAQIGLTDYIPTHIQWSPIIDPAEYRQRISDADAVVAHAGMGTILTAFELGTPILVMPRRGELKETRNDHQVATAQRFLEMGRLTVAMDENVLPVMLDEISDLKIAETNSKSTTPELIQALKAFIHKGDNK
jgi:UDP-N-acetylglucosamine transferase subunit ALG13